MASRRYAAKRRSTSRRTYRKKRAYPTRRTTRKRTYRKKTSRKSLADRMSHKKRDTMLSQAGAAVNPSPGAATASRSLVLGALTTNTSAQNVHMTFNVPSWRWLVPNNYDYLAARTSTRTYVKGLSETYDITPSDASSWTWRRIVFTYKGDFALPDASQYVIGENGAQSSASAVSYRQMRDITGDTTGGYVALWDKIQDFLFRGVKTTDWANQLTVPVDTQRVDLLSDRTRFISSNNDSPRPRTFRTYVPVNKTLVYDDEENGTIISPTPYAVDTKVGIGNIYVIDMFCCRAPINTTSTQIQIASTQTYYWHEK